MTCYCLGMLNNTNTVGGPYGLHCTCVPVADDSLAALLAQVSCERCVLASEYSDRYKDARGIRPRHHGDWDIETLESEVRYLCDLAHDAMEDDLRAEYDRKLPTSGEGWAFVPANPDGFDGLREDDADCYADAWQ